MVDFGGWDMPVQYSTISDEHLAVRTSVGLFDVSHMGEIEIAGDHALEAVQHVTTNDASRLAIGQIQYSMLTNPSGGVIDDVLVYRLAESHYLLVVNAGNIRKDVDWITSQTAALNRDVVVFNASSRYALIAIQGPAAVDVVSDLCTLDLGALRYYRFASGEVAGARVVVSRTGYSGEDGFEIFVPPAQAPKLWDDLLRAGQRADIRPCGLGARDTLRLECCMRLYGNEMDETVSPLEAGLGWTVKFDKPAFVGRDALRAEEQAGSRRRLVAFEMSERAIARHGHMVLRGDEPCGTVTSGTQTPYLQKAIGMALVPADMAAPGTPLTIDIRGRRASAVVVPEPFYKRGRPAAGPLPV
jgi:aminomethyltransferase